ncbi:HET-domain-containing protein [Fomes fomentarius]|nr:HET-domain-containing protein [Fomes fomentarius]
MMAFSDPEPGSPDNSHLKSLVCDSCSNIGLFDPASFQKAWDAQFSSTTGFSYATTWSQVQHAAQSGCRWCTLVSSTRNNSYFPIRGETLEVAIHFSLPSEEDATIAPITPQGVQRLHLELNGRAHSAYYYVSAAPDDPAAAVITSRTRILKLYSPSTRLMASNCISDCIREHEHCPSPYPGVLPTRVIDCGDPIRPKLHLSHSEPAPYVALSYVWGESQSYITTTTNLETYLDGIDPGLLPQTIKDAIGITHAHGVRYLWIDSLCILQDSDEDKAREIAQMRAIYENAYFTIIAASARAVSHGFLQDRSPHSPYPSPPDIVLPFPSCPNGGIGTMVLSDPNWVKYDGASEPIDQRAWCLQERFLSPRALVYASHTLQYQCRTSTVNMGNAVCDPSVRKQLPHFLFRTDSNSSASYKLSPRDQKKLLSSWISMVEQYTRRALSNPDDKLIAFAAIPELFSRCPGWEGKRYLAGLWEGTLAQDLLWRKAREMLSPRPNGYRAPSWSWAAVDGLIVARQMDDRLDLDTTNTATCDILGCEVEPATPIVPFGKVASGTLHVRAVLVEATWNYPPSKMPKVYLRVSVAADRHQQRERPRIIGYAYPDSVESVEEVLVVPVIWNLSARYAAGLVVTRVEGGRYRRVGCFHSPEESAGLDWMVDEEKQDVIFV